MNKFFRSLHFFLYKILVYLIFSSILVVNAKADETSFFLGSSVANTTIQENGYKSDTSFALNFGYRFSSIYLESNVTNLGSFKLKRSTDTKINLKGISLLLGKQFNIAKELNMNIHGGAILWKADATLLNKSVGDDQKTSAMLGLGISYFFKIPKLSIRSQIQYLFDISETDISLLSVGINYHI
ncbi:MAG: outer membrane beta-barrel protein [Gammaproteobacteria bacterium]|nr:outer membrane beta-barrel protein [Gammaproteobacteria bacterium]